MFEIIYKENTAKHDDIILHLKSCDMQFMEELFARVNPDQYVAKILTNASLHEAWHGDRLIGLLAVYKNDQYYFITNVSISQDFVKRGIASSLIEGCIKNRGQNEVRLEVSKTNDAAANLYKKFGFVEIRQDDKSNYLVLK